MKPENGLFKIFKMVIACLLAVTVTLYIAEATSIWTGFEISDFWSYLTQKNLGSAIALIIAIYGGSVAIQNFERPPPPPPGIVVMISPDDEQRLSSAPRSLLSQDTPDPLVEKIQQILLNLGYNIRIDGLWGPETESAVRSFQEKHSLNVDGIVGSSTITVMRSLDINTK